MRSLSLPLPFNSLKRWLLLSRRVFLFYRYACIVFIILFCIFKLPAENGSGVVLKGLYNSIIIRCLLQDALDGTACKKSVFIRGARLLLEKTALSETDLVNGPKLANSRAREWGKGERKADVTQVGCASG